MLIPHLHFCGDCYEAILFYEKAFNIQAESIMHNSDFTPDECKGDNRIAHAVMYIHDQKIFLNDRFGNKVKSTDVAVHLIIMFKNTDELLSCYENMKPDSITIDPLEELPYSKLAVQFIDKFGVLWGFMVEESEEV
jgi:PhnB protein